jgi:very-short-patch-repair endonuclease
MAAAKSGGPVMAKADKIVLVAVVGRLKDLTIARRDRWYRIPVGKAPRRRPDYVAFYQTSAFGADGKAVRFYAPVRSISTVSRRRLLSDEKNHPRSGDRYLKLDLGPVRTTPRIIRNRTRRRVTFGFTTLGKLKRASEICQLFDISPVEEIMRRHLLRSGIPASHEHCVMDRKRLRYRLDFAVFCRKGRLAVECDNEKWHLSRRQRVRDCRRDKWLARRGWTVLRFPGTMIRNDPEGCVKTVKAAIRKLGGVLRCRGRGPQGRESR